MRRARGSAPPSLARGVRRSPCCLRPGRFNRRPRRRLHPRCPLPPGERRVRGRGHTARQPTQGHDRPARAEDFAVAHRLRRVESAPHGDLRLHRARRSGAACRTIGRRPHRRLRLPRRLGENIAAGFTTPAAVLAAWLQSPGHRANIENPAYVVTGAGASVSANGVTVWAQDFGLTDDSGSTGPAKSATPTAQNKIILRKLHVTQRSGRLVLHVRALLAPSMQPLRRGSTGCGASAGDRKLHVIVRRFSQGAVTCVWRIPTASRPIKATVFVSTRTARPAHATVAVIPR